MPARNKSSIRRGRQKWAEFIALALRNLPGLGKFTGGPSRSTYDTWETQVRFPGKATAERAITDVWTQLQTGVDAPTRESLQREMAIIFPAFDREASQASLIEWVGTYVDDLRLAERTTRAQARHTKRQKARSGEGLQPARPTPSRIVRHRTPALSPLPWLQVPQLEWRTAQHGTASLLRAEARAVPFHGQSQSEALPQLIAWCESGEDRAFRAYSGPGGFGKTRLGLSLCDSLKSQAPRWVVGFLQVEQFDLDRDLWAGLKSNADGVLVVIDYAADVAKTAAIKRLLGELDACPVRRQRVLFLEREHLWIGRILRHAPARIALESALFERDGFEMLLRPVASTPESRAESFQCARDAFASHLGSRQDREPLPKFRERIYDQVLLLHTQALLSVLGPLAAPREDSILTQLLERERAYWQRLAMARGMGDGMLPVIEQACRVITSNRGVGSLDEGLTLCQENGVLSELPTISLTETVALLRECYPSGATGIGPLEPDLLGQKLVALPSPIRRRGAVVRRTNKQ